MYALPAASYQIVDHPNKQTNKPKLNNSVQWNSFQHITSICQSTHFQSWVGCSLGNRSGAGAEPECQTVQAKPEFAYGTLKL